MFIANRIPTYVATPLPPLNLNQIGNTCPKKADKADMKINSGEMNLTYKTGITALRISRTKVEQPINLFPVLNAFVAPILPEPISLISLLRNIFVNIKPKGIDPARYEITPIVISSIFIF